MTDSLDTKGQINAKCLDYLLTEMIANSIRTSYKDDDALASIDPSRTLISYDQSLINNDDVTIRNENYGYQVGIRLSELIMYKTCAPKIDNILDIMKFVCRDVWKSIFNKQMDNLRTNHRGVFVLVDNNFQYINSMNSAKGVPDSIARSRSLLWFPCGIIRGILSTFGIDAVVSAEISQFPAVTFNIHTTINN